MRGRERARARALAVAIEPLARERLGHHAVDRLAVMHEPDQRAPGRQPGNEALGPVDRIEDPDIFRLGAILPIFLTDHPMGGKRLRDQPPHGRLGAPVGLGDGIEHPAQRLVFGANCAAKKWENHLARDLRKSFHEGCKVNCGHPIASQAREMSCPLCISAIHISDSISLSYLSTISFYIIDIAILLSVSSLIGAFRQKCHSAPDSGVCHPQDKENTCNGGGQRRYCCGAA